LRDWERLCVRLLRAIDAQETPAIRAIQAMPARA
jgi:hypothetical protein